MQHRTSQVLRTDMLYKKMWISDGQLAKPSREYDLNLLPFCDGSIGKLDRGMCELRGASLFYLSPAQIVTQLRFLFV